MKNRERKIGERKIVRFFIFLSIIFLSS